MTLRIYLLVEGQTEERFVKDVLAPTYENRGLFFTPILLTTKRVVTGPNFRGGVGSFNKFKDDMDRLLSGAGSSPVTTLIDYYGLPPDFPGMADRPLGPAIRRVEYVESSLRAFFGNRPRFFPFLALHEFEAWLFSSSDALPTVLAQKDRCVEFERVRKTFQSPEDINENPDLSPSRRIAKMFPGYRKALHGPMAAKQMGLDVVRAQCPHLSSWLRAIEDFAPSPNERPSL